MRSENSRQKWWLAGILGVAAFLRFWNLWRFGLHHDAALNSSRALGWFDFLVGIGQTSPLVWFGQIPWWGNLSFHDHPPLSFALQKVFFFLFGDASFVALLPFVLAGVAATALIYRLTKDFGQSSAALWATAVFAVSAYAVWSSRAGYLEGLLVLWIVCSLFFFTRFVTFGQNRDLYFWMTAVAFALLTKYTAIFLLPAAGVYLLLKKREVFFSRHFWLAVLLFLALLSPVVIYNAQVYAARGHFDAALSSMLGMSPQDYSVLSYRSVGAGFGTNLWNIALSVKNNSSLGFGLLFGVSGFFTLVMLFLKRASPLVRIILLNLVFASLMMAFSGAADRFVPILLPLLAILAGVMLASLANAALAKPAVFRLFAFTASVVLAFELVFSLNTNVLITPQGAPGWAYAASRFNMDGFEELDRYLRKNVYGRIGSPRRITNLDSSAAQFSLTGREVVLFDERADWFSRVWYVDRYAHYYQKPILYFTDLNEAIAKSSNPDEDFLAYLRRAGVTGAWAVVAAGPAVSSSVDPDYSALMQALDVQLTAAKVLAHEITIPSGETVFRIFHFQ